jgi:hypothetical protein
MVATHYHEAAALGETRTAKEIMQGDAAKMMRRLSELASEEAALSRLDGQARAVKRTVIRAERAELRERMAALNKIMKRRGLR